MVADQTGANPVERAEMPNHLCSPVLCGTASAKNGRGSDKGGAGREEVSVNVSMIPDFPELRPINNSRLLLVYIRDMPKLGPNKHLCFFKYFVRGEVPSSVPIVMQSARRKKVAARLLFPFLSGFSISTAESRA